VNYKWRLLMPLETNLYFLKGHKEKDRTYWNCGGVLIEEDKQKTTQK
jgi:hypothetical protein